MLGDEPGLSVSVLWSLLPILYHRFYEFGIFFRHCRIVYRRVGKNVIFWSVNKYLRDEYRNLEICFSSYWSRVCGFLKYLIKWQIYSLKETWYSLNTNISKKKKGWEPGIIQGLRHLACILMTRSIPGIVYSPWSTSRYIPHWARNSRGALPSVASPHTN